ncbi:hypothetical protein [Neorhizobium sp. T6_25]|uniref:hypothetical protein n=1 Tax=Neorhizobium sp. T6_25 TaxID=2093833 RepID=UPI000CFA7377|nr:hypothetical protein [Neorhizobium sp. T6_25]
MTKFSVSDKRLKNLNEAAAAFTAVCGSQHYTDAIRFTLRQLVHREEHWDSQLLLVDLDQRHLSSIFEIGLRRYDFLAYVGDSFKFDHKFRHYIEQVLEILALEQFFVLKGKLIAAEGDAFSGQPN